MRTIRNQSIPQDGDNTKFPDGQIRNETETQTGTPVVREIYGDHHSNIFAILRYAGIIPNEQEDSTVNGHQLLDALKVFSNSLNDVKQLITVSGNEITLGFNFDFLPDNYVFIGQISDDILSSVNYTITGTGINSFTLNSSNDITASSIVLVVLNSAGSQIYSLTQTPVIPEIEEIINTSFGNPIGFNESSDLLYISGGFVITNEPSSFDIQTSIRIFESDNDWNLLECILHKNKLICITQNQSTFAYKMYAFDKSDLTTLEGEITFPVNNTIDNYPYMFCDGANVYFTNTTAQVNDSVNNYSVGKFLFNEITLVMTFVSSFTLSNILEKTTNTFIDSVNGWLYTYINSELVRYDFSGSRLVIGFFNTINGSVFKFNGSTYYSNGNIATKWIY